MPQAENEKKGRAEDTEDEPDDWYVKRWQRLCLSGLLIRGNPKGQENHPNWLRRYELDFCSFRSNQDAELTYVAEQNELNDCYFDKKDWRSCTSEVGHIRLEDLESHQSFVRSVFIRVSTI